MGEISGVYDENDPKIKTRLAFLAKMNEQARSKIASWQDVYDGLREISRLYSSAPSQATASVAVTLLHSFVIALEQLPEEGDALVVAYRMNEILIMRDDLTGMSLYTDEAEAMSGALLRLTEAVQAIAACVEEGPAPDAAETNGSRRLH